MNLKRIYLRIRESSTSLNVPTPTPAPDRGGPIACLSGPERGWRQKAKPLAYLPEIRDGSPKVRLYVAPLSLAVLN